MTLTKLFKKPEVIRPYATTEMVWRTGEKVRPLWQPNRLGLTLERMFGVGLRSWPFGHLTPVYRTHNIITNVGHAAANGKLSNQGGYLTFVTIAVGVGTTTASITDTTLGDDRVGARGRTGHGRERHHAAGLDDHGDRNVGDLRGGHFRHHRRPDRERREPAGQAGIRHDKCEYR